MTTNINITYQQYVWRSVHSEIHSKCCKIRNEFLIEKKRNNTMNRTDFLHRHVLDGTVLSIHSLPQEEVVAVLQYSEMNEDNDYIKCGLVFDTICNLWNYIGETEVQNFSSLSDSEQFDYFKNVKADFLDWFSKENISNDMDLEILNNAIHLPLLHRMSGHSTLEIIICYLLC